MATTADEIRETAQAVCATIDVVAPRGSPIDARSSSLIDVLSALDDDRLSAALTNAARLRAAADAAITVGAGIVAKRSQRELGYSGLAQRQGYRTPVAMVQSLTGSSRAEASRQVRLGEAMGEADAAARLSSATTDPADSALGDDAALNAGAGGGVDGAEYPDRQPESPWFSNVTEAVASHRIPAEAGSAILRGLREPNEHVSAAALRTAADELLEKAPTVNVDELGKLARWARDRIDPIGVEERTTERYEARAWRFSRNARGMRTAFIEFDDDSAAFVDSLVGSAMRPRRGGPRFIHAEERARAQAIVDDSRSNEQLVFDLLMDTIRAGVQADPRRGFGNRQPGVRYVVTSEQRATTDENGYMTGIGHLEDSGEAVSGAVIERALCDVGSRTVTVDSCGRPLDVGRDQRLFTERQRVALTIRDGGCMWPGCDRPPSYTEAHHIDHWWAHHGRTDTADGILLCRHHHMLLHNQHWRVRREGGAYLLIPPTSIDPQQLPIVLHSKSPLRFAVTG